MRMRLTIQHDRPNPHACPAHAWLSLAAIEHICHDLRPSFGDDNAQSAMAHEVQVGVGDSSS